jgi:hypothetical protein
MADPLQLAHNCLDRVETYAEYQSRDALLARVYHVPEAGHQAAFLAGALALVSVADSMAALATDVHHIRQQLEGGAADAPRAAG